MSSRRLVLVVAAAAAIAMALLFALDRRSDRALDAERGDTTSTDAGEATTTPELAGRATPDAGVLDPALEPSDGVRGRVIDRATGKPVVGARVQVFAYGSGRREEVETDATGRYALPGLEAGGAAVAVVVDTEGHGRRLHSRVSPGTEATTITLDEGGWITGRVEDSEGGVPDGLEILALDRPHARPGTSAVHDPLVRLALPADLAESPRRFPLDEGGAFRVGPLAEGVYGLLLLPASGPPRLALAGGETYERSAGYRVEPGQTTDAGAIQLSALGHGVFRVLDANTDEPLPGVRFTYDITLDHRRRSFVASGVTVNEKGAYEVPLAMRTGRPAVENHTIGVACNGYVGTSLSFGWQRSGSSFTARLRRASDAASVHGRILDEAGAPIAGALVMVRKEVDHVGLQTAASNAEGRFAFQGLAAGIPLHLVVLGPDLMNAITIVAIKLAPGESRELDLGGPATTALSVEVRYLGVPLEEAFLSLDTTDDKRTQFHSGPDGHVRFDGIPAGRHELFISILGEKGMETRPVVVESGKTTSLVIDFRYEARGTFELQDASGQPLPIESYTRLAVRRTDVDDDVVSEGPVAEDGTFAFLLSAPGRYRFEPADWHDPVVHVRSPEFEIEDLAPLEPLDLVWRMEAKDGRIEIDVTYAESGTPVAEGDYGYRWRTTNGAAMYEGGTILREACGLGEHTFTVNAVACAPETIAITLTAEERRAHRKVQLEKSNGVQILEFATDSRAQTAGLRPGDILVRYAETPILHMGDLRRALASTTPKERVRLTLRRNDRQLQIDAPGGRLGVRMRNVRWE